MKYTRSRSAPASSSCPLTSPTASSPTHRMSPSNRGVLEEGRFTRDGSDRCTQYSAFADLLARVKERERAPVGEPPCNGGGPSGPVARTLGSLSRTSPAGSRRRSSAIRSWSPGMVVSGDRPRSHRSSCSPRPFGAAARARPDEVVDLVLHPSDGASADPHRPWEESTHHESIIAERDRPVRSITAGNRRSFSPPMPPSEPETELAKKSVATACHAPVVPRVRHRLRPAPRGTCRKGSFPRPKRISIAAPPGALCASSSASRSRLDLPARDDPCLRW